MSTRQSFPDGQSDFTAILSRTPFQPCGRHLRALLHHLASLIISQAASAGCIIAKITGRRYLGVRCDSGRAEGHDSESIIFSTFFDENDKSDVAATFVSGFKEWLKADPRALDGQRRRTHVAAVSALGYDAYMTAIEAIKIANSTTGENIQDALAKVSFAGVTGQITFPNERRCSQERLPSSSRQTMASSSSSSGSLGKLIRISCRAA